VLQANALACFDEMLATYAAKFRVVKDQVRELSALLDEVHSRQSGDLVVEAMKTDEFAQNDARVVEAEASGRNRWPEETALPCS